MPPGNEYAAEQLKTKGNACFKNADYDGAESFYSLAIQKNPANPLLFTNRAMARSKLLKWDAVIDDCIRSIELLPENMKAFHLLSQAQLAVNHPNEALSSALKAYEYCTNATQQTTFSNAALISQHVLKCKKRKWEIRERERIRRRTTLLSELEQHLERTHKQDLDTITARLESKQLTPSSAAEEIHDRTTDHTTKIADLRTAFALSSPDELHIRDVPDYLIDGITFEIMHDPVVTNNGRSYERATLIEHLKRSPTDPLTREPLRIAHLRPNLALRDACQAFMEENSGWVYDW